MRYKPPSDVEELALALGINSTLTTMSFKLDDILNTSFLEKASTLEETLDKIKVNIPKTFVEFTDNEVSLNIKGLVSEREISLDRSRNMLSHYDEFLNPLLSRRTIAFPPV
jgi:hypothetical protein